MTDFRDIPIDVSAAGRTFFDHCEGKTTEGQKTVLTGGISVASQVFIALREMMDAVVRGTDWNKKTRIVLEYDPQSRKMELLTFGSADETQKTAGR